MSLDVHLYDVENGAEIFYLNITHNLTRMARECGMYDCLWCPREHGFKRASQLIEPLTAGLSLLVTQKARFEAFNAPNGFGRWADFVLRCADYLQVCRDNPTAHIYVSR